MAGRTEKTPTRGTRPPLKRAAGRDGAAARIESENVPSAAELPVTRAMLGAVRTELLERIDQAKVELKAELKAEINGVKAELSAEINGVKAEINGVKAELSAEINGVKVQIDVLQAGQHEMKASIARMAFLFEEQNARNTIVLDALTAVIQRQDRQEQRMDQVEETVQALASARPAG